MPLRLLKTHSIGLELIEFDDIAYPPYAILSHVWDKGQEIEYHELAQSQQLKHKHGWRKIAEAKRVAREHGLEYIWIDTCCIDKSSSAELAEALNSMFAWYQKATICYAYLRDVLDRPLFSLPNVRDVDESLQANINKHANHQKLLLELENNMRWNMFMQSRWFTRGWTLQELLAPSSLVFFDMTWNTIGSMNTTTDDGFALAHVVSDITGIDEDLLLRKRSMQSYSIAQKMSWAADRQTTRIEDRAYSLLGLFDISMAVIYGEGERAFRRLQEELLQSYSDPTIFAWQGPFEELTAAVPQSGESVVHCARADLLASSPKAFSECSEMVPLSGSNQQQLFQVIGGIVRFDSRTYKYSNQLGAGCAVVVCRQENSRTNVVLLRLQSSPSNDSFFASSCNRLQVLDIHTADFLSKQRVVDVWKNANSQYHNEATALTEILVRARPSIYLTQRFKVLSAQPSNVWNAALQAFEIPATSADFDGLILVSVSGHGEESIKVSMRGGRLYASFHNSGLLEAFVNLPFVLARDSLKHVHEGVLIVRASNGQLLGCSANLIEVELVSWSDIIFPFFELLTKPTLISLLNIVRTRAKKLLEPPLDFVELSKLESVAWMRCVDYLFRFMIGMLLFYALKILFYRLIVYNLGLAFT